MIPITIIDDMGEEAKIMSRLSVACVVVTTQYGDKVAFTKTNKGQNYRDSRGKKVTKKNEYGDKETILRPLMITEDEVRAELLRLLDCSATASQAFYALQA